MTTLLGYKATNVYFVRAKRFAGETKYSFGKLLNIAIDGITSFTNKPVRMVSVLGILFLFISLIIMIYVLVSFFRGISITGWASLMLSLWFCSGCLLVSMGVIGEYIGRIYIEVKDRPRYNIEETLMK